MAVERSSPDNRTKAQQVVLLGVLALLAEARESRVSGDKNATKTELLLERAGMSVDDIAAVMGKSSDAVRKAVSRGKAK